MLTQPLNTLFIFIGYLFIVTSSDDKDHWVYQFKYEEGSTLSCIYGTSLDFEIFFAKYNNHNKGRKTTKLDSLLTDIIQNLKQAEDQDLSTCLPLFRKHHQHPQHQLSIDRMYKYGRWCGDDYGGFNNDCKKDCQQNQWTPSQDCVNCNPPIDWTDEQCMYHDFCMERFQVYKIGNATVCMDSMSLGASFPSPCSCPFNLTLHLRPDFLQANCPTYDCIWNGNLIYDFFTDPAVTCGCTYQVCAQENVQLHRRNKHLKSHNKIGNNETCWQAQACVGVDECVGLHSQYGQEDEGELKQ